MALIVADRVKQESTTTGTGALSFAGGVDGFENFSVVCSTNDTMYYCIQDKVGTNFEIGHGTFNASGQLERTNVLQSSNSDNTVDFGAGTKEVFITYPADKAVFQNFNGSITIPSTIDGRDLQTDGTKLDGIEASATADQTASEIRTLVESASDSNVFTDSDHTKLNGIESSATADQTGAEIKSAYEGEADTNALTDTLLSKLNGIEASATADQTDAQIRTAVEAASDSNVFTDADHTKLNGIEASATADQSGAEIKSAYEGEADTNAFTDTLLSKLNGIASGAEVNVNADWTSSSGDSQILNKPSLATVATSGAYSDLSGTPTVPTNNNQLTNGAGYITSATDSTKLPLAGGTMTGDLILNDNVRLEIGSNADGDLALYHDGNHSYIDERGTGNLYLKGSVVSLQSNTAEQMVSANGNGAVELYYNNTNRANTTNTGFGVIGELTCTGNMTSSNNVTAYSDQRLKSDIKTIDNALDKVSQMRGVTFTKDGEHGSGVIAQELEKIAPELVQDGEYKSVAYGNTVGYLIEAIKELKERNEKLELIVNKLITDVEEMEVCSCP